MPEVLERPAPFTDPNKAREAGLKSALMRQQTEQELANLRQLLQTKPIEQPEQKPVNSEVAKQIELTNELIACARVELKRLQEDDYGFCPECKRHGSDAKEQAALLRELRGLMEHLCRLHNIAQAPTSKATNKPQVQRQTAPEPVVPCGVAPTISSVPQRQPTDSTPQSK